MNYFEFTGKTVDEAIENGLKELNVTREDVTVEVLEEGKKKLFSSVKARVKLGVKAEEQAEEVAKTVVEETTKIVNTPTCDELSDGQRAVQFLDGLFEVLNFTATAELVKEDEKIEINVTAKNTTEVIGKHGATIDAIQTLAGAVANTGRDKYIRVVVDCENYRDAREATLQKLADNLAQKAIRLGRKIKLEPMNPYERRIIHAALSEHEGIKTQSEGKEPQRYIVVIPDNLVDPDAPAIPARNERNDRRDNYRGNRSGNRNGGRNDRGGYKKNYGGRSGGQRPSGKGGSSAGGTTLKNTDFFGTFLGNSKKN